MKTIRLIELFSGIGTQAMALKQLDGINVELHKAIEIDKYSMASYNACHATHFTTQDIMQVTGKDLEITDRDTYIYMLTYSFPCTDLSCAGLQKGMSEQSGTRSSLLWQVKRLLNELGDNLPHVLVMENVPQVHNKKNIDDFWRWIYFLESKGYQNFYRDLNALDFGVAQSRNRCFMVSFLSPKEVPFNWPKEVPLNKKMKDYLESNVDSKFYLNNEHTRAFIKDLKAKNLLESIDNIDTVVTCNKGDNFVKKTDIACTLMARDYKGMSTYQNNGVVERYGNIYGTDKGTSFAGNVWNTQKNCPTLTSMQGCNRQPLIMCAAMRSRHYRNPEASNCIEVRKDTNTNTITSVQKDNVLIDGYGIRRLTPRECWRLMGISDSYFDKASKVCSNTQLYKQAGNAIVVDVLKEIFKEIINCYEKQN